MVNSIDKQILLQTKLHRPRVTADLVHRSRLKALLNNGLDHSLILVSAPAGFGKSTLLSAWLETIDLPNAWVSLNEADNDLGVFLTYFLSALQTIFPDSLPETQTFLSSINLPDVTAIARSLINELVELDHDFILVLDDYHLIREQSIHEFLNLLLQYPPSGLHLVIATRQDPLLSLSVFRARHQVAEIRGQNLRFSKAEITEFVEKATGLSLTAEVLDMLADKTEGWATGLRLATLTLRFGTDVDSNLARLQAENRYVTDYLMSEVLSNVSPGMRNFLIKTSILDQVCAPLGSAMVCDDDPDCEPQVYLDWLVQADMFTIALDTQGEWYRYHHLFQELLRKQLTRQASAAEIDTLHIRASAWYSSQGSLEEALHHALLGHDMETAVHLIEEHRQTLMKREQWQRFQRIFNMFPADMVDLYPELLLMAAHVALLKNANRAYILELFDRADILLTQMLTQSQQSAHAVHLKSEIDVFRAAFACEAASDPEKTIALEQRALATLPREWYYLRAVAWLWLSLAYQMAGKLDLAYATLAQGQPEDVTSDGSVHIRVGGGRYFIAWMAGDLRALPQHMHQMLAISETHQRHESQMWAHYFLSSLAYEQNDFATAETHITAVEKMRYGGLPIIYLQSMFIAASICQARGQAGQAQHKLEQIYDFLRETHNEGFALIANAFQAELSARQGDLDVAGHWATTIGPFLPLTIMPYFYVLQLTLPKILLAQDTPDSLQQAAEVLTQLHTFVTATHNTRVTIEVLALQALLHDAQGNEPAALTHLQQALLLAEPGGYIRLFVDLGPKLASLLKRLPQVGANPKYVGQLLGAFEGFATLNPNSKATTRSTSQTEMVELLTAREHEVLILLGQRLTDKEIAQALIISVPTVKQHTSHIYQKFQVSGRREAVAQAMRLGLL